VSEIKHVYLLIGRILSKTYPSPKLKKELSEFTAWETLVKIGSAQLLLPALYWNLEHKGLLNAIPEDLMVYLREIYQINYHRNRSILEQAKQLNAVLKAKQIDAVFLKGVALFQYLREEQQGLRMVGDIDVLIPEEQLLETQDLLIEKGYGKGKGFDYQPKGFRHLDRLVHPNYIAAVELHSHLLNLKNNHYLPAKDVLQNQINTNGVGIPSAEHMTLHAIYSAQITNHGNYYRRIRLKPVYDCLLLDLPKNASLMQALLAAPEAQWFLAVANYFMPDFSGMIVSKELENTIQKINPQFRYPKAYRLESKLKKAWLATSSRILLFATNDSYRQHVLKNKIFQLFN